MSRGRRDEGGTDYASDYGQTWVYESLVGAIPGVEIPDRVAVALQFTLFEAGVLVGTTYYGLPAQSVLAGSVGVAVAALGSVAMLHLGDRIRDLDAPDAYRHLLFGSSVEVALGVFAFVALVAYLFVVDPRSGESLFRALFGGRRPPIPVAYLMLLIMWDVCYRIGTGWWASVAALWRSYRFAFDTDTAAAYRRIDLANLGFAAAQLALVPFVADHPILAVAVVGHVVAVTTVVTGSVLLLRD